jgi:hypothetical protein
MSKTNHARRGFLGALAGLFAVPMASVAVADDKKPNRSSLNCWALITAKIPRPISVVVHPPGDMHWNDKAGVTQSIPYRDLAKTMLECVRSGGVFGIPFDPSESGENMWGLFPGEECREYAGFVTERMIGDKAFFHVAVSPVKGDRAWECILSADAVVRVSVLTEKEAHDHAQWIHDSHTKGVADKFKDAV